MTHSPSLESPTESPILPTSEIHAVRYPPGFSPQERAHDLWRLLRLIEAQSTDIGGRELFLLVSCAREVVERRWGPFKT